MKKILRHLFLFFTLSLIGFVYFCMLTNPGLKIGVKLITSILPGKTTIDKAEGSFISAFSLKNISYQDSNKHIQIESIALSWRPYDIFKKQLHINSITLKNADINIQTSYSQSSLEKIPAYQWLSFIKLDKVIFQKVNVQQANNKLLLNGNLTDHWDINWNLFIPQLTSIKTDMTGSITSSGTLTGLRFLPKIIANIDIYNLAHSTFNIAQLHANADITFDQKKNSTLVITGKNLNLTDYPVSKINFSSIQHFYFDRKTLKTFTLVTINQEPAIRVSLNLPEFSLNQLNYQKISGDIDFSTLHIQMLTDFIPDIKNTKGQLEGKIKLSGKLLDPKIASTLYLKNGQFTFPELGTTLNNINLQSNYSTNNNQLKITGSFKSKENIAQLSGTIDLSKANYPTLISIQGNNLNFVDLPHYKISISPDIQIHLSYPKMTLTGTINIPKADITPTDFSNTTVMPDEVIYVGMPKKQNFNLFSNFNLDLNVILGENIHIQYQDFQASLTGEIHITQTPGNTALGTGELYTTTGKYHVYGQLLTIQRGRLIYAGNALLNPGLDIRAARDIKTITTNAGASEFSKTPVFQPTYIGNDELTVGVQVHGTAKKPIIALFSNPTMSQSDMLSYLLFGTPQSQIKGTAQLGALLNATSALNANGKTPLSDMTNGIQNKLGLNELGLGSTEIFNPTTGTASATTSFIVGKQLARNLYIHYSIGLFNPVSILNLRYKLSKRWAIQSETSTIDSGVDFLYTLERN
jgi:translocation and assembly module TamB